MSRVTLWYIACALFLIAAIVSAIGSQWIFAAAAVAIAMAMLVLAMRERRRGTSR